MASVLIVENDGLVASQMARTLREAGHLPIRAPDGRAGLQEALSLPDLILLDLGLPDLPGEEVLRRLRNQPRTATIPILVVTGKTEAAARLQRVGEIGTARILLKPVSGAILCQAVEGILEQKPEQAAECLPWIQGRRAAIIQRLIAEGSDGLAIHLYRRLTADRMQGKGRPPANTLTWTEIADKAKREGLLDPDQARLLRSTLRPRDPTDSDQARPDAGIPG
ncbi:MAG: response regulator transcription factor [candidate division NC10 bacterium]|nr:response regulator transcription factor [candidate division NC10 bacterium]